MIEFVFVFFVVVLLFDDVFVFVCEWVGDVCLLLGELFVDYLVGMVVIMCMLNVDLFVMQVVVLFVLMLYLSDFECELIECFGDEVVWFVFDVCKLLWFGIVSLCVVQNVKFDFGCDVVEEWCMQIEVLCKMLFVFVQDICVVLIWFVLWLQLLCYYVAVKFDLLFDVVCEMFEIYVLFVNCFGIW